MARYLARAVAAFQYLRLAAEHDGLLRVDPTSDLIGGARQVRAGTAGDNLLDPRLGVQFDAEVQFLEPKPWNKMRTL
jgi:hypothetical protein